MSEHELFAAIAAGDAEQVGRIVTRDPGARRARDASGVTALLQAQYHRRPDLVELLSAPDDELDVYEAAALGRAGRVAELVDADPALANAHGPDGFHPLALAAFFGRADAVRALLDRGADPALVARHEEIQVNALQAAAAGSHTLVAGLLVDAGAPVDAAQPGGYTPLHSAAANGNEALVELLLAEGANPEARTDDGRTPHDLAAERGHDVVVTLLS